MNYKDLEDINVISVVQSIEADYGMDTNNWPENDIRLKRLRKWYINHSDEKKTGLTYRDMQKIQKSLDEQIPKKTICEIFGISSGKLAHDIELGKLSDDKWRNGRKNKK